VLLFAAGIALLYWQIDQLVIDGRDIREAFADVGWWFSVILLLSFLRFVLRSAAWKIVLERPVSLWRMTAATLSGDALGNIIPVGGVIAGEPAKAVYLRHDVDPGRGFAALVAETFFYSVSVAIYVMVAVAAMFAYFAIPDGVHLAGVIALGSMSVVLAGATWLAWQRPALASQTLVRIAGVRAARWVERLRAFEVDTYGAVGQQGGRLATVAACEVGFHVLSLAECYLVFYLLTGEVGLLPSLVFDGFNRVINIVGRPVPFKLGVDEGLTALLAGAIGFPPHGGFLLALVRKVRLIVWSGVGIALWGIRRR
jgi:hypothetical protein